jgi:succinate dehydrogenase flavin-adding protein (antitoxin of CptAB toxin-antitoxin module)
VEDPSPQDRSRLAGRCRRGRREWDVLLLGWLERHYEAASGSQRAAFAALLELPDAELERYLGAAEHPLGADLPGMEPSGDRRI